MAHLLSCVVVAGRASRRLGQEALALAGVGMAGDGGDRLDGDLGGVDAGGAQRGGEPCGQRRLVDAAGGDDRDVGLWICQDR
jgi:hypothetical protein